jgi:hypothetical protein
MAKSELERFLEREKQELLIELEPHRELARGQDVYGQAVLGGWCGLAQVARRTGLAGERGEQLIDSFQLEANGYAPSDDDPDREVIPSFCNATLNGVVEDLGDGEVRLGELRESLENLLRIVDRYGGPQTSMYGAATFGMVLGDLFREGFEPQEIAPAAACVIPWQRLLWLVECGMRGGAVLARGRGEPIVGDPSEQLTYLMRLAANQPGLGSWPELARFVPKRAENLLPLSEQAYKRFRREGIPDDPELAERLVTEILERRHYTLEAMSVIELEELGVKRIVLTPEERPDTMVRGHNPQFIAGFLVDHAAGTFAGSITLGDDSALAIHGRRAVVMVPAILDQTSREMAEHEPDVADPRDVAHVHEAQSAVELLLLSAWRDLVVPEVREQHYEIDRVRKAKGKRARAAKRGDVEIIRYLPRRLVLLREERERSVGTGAHQPRRLYPVGAFSRRLPEGQKRSQEAEAFAAESGIPLAPWQTVVRPHWRGGTEEEREHAMENPELDVRHWRSWSAIDLLRTRLARADGGAASGS